MPVVAQDRPINALREEAIDQLIMNYGHGKLSLEAFERRLDRALDAKSHDEILELTADLDLIADKTYTGFLASSTSRGWFSSMGEYRGFPYTTAVLV